MHRVVSIVGLSYTSISATNNHFTQKKRLQLAIAYIKKHGNMTAKKYSEITNLKRTVTLAELEAFAMDKQNPIQVNKVKKKEIFTLRHE